jgi:hypothetical protein
MRSRRRWAFGASVMACAMGMLASAARGGAVCGLDHDDAAAMVASDNARPSEWIAQILGEGLDAPQVATASAQTAETPEPLVFQSHLEAADTDGGPRAAVIPLPPPVWSGAIGLGALVAGSGIRKLRKML